jgi:anti-anti-sigma factor
MEIVQRRRGDVAVLELKGALDHGAGDRYLERVISDLDKQGCVRVVIDLNEVSHMDTTCLGLLIAANLRLRRHGGGLNLLKTPRRIRQILLIARLDQVLLSFGTEEEAISAFPVAASTPSSWGA